MIAVQILELVRVLSQKEMRHDISFHIDTHLHPLDSMWILTRFEQKHERLDRPLCQKVARIGAGLVAGQGIIFDGVQFQMSWRVL